MVLRGTQIQRCGQARCSLVSAQSLPHDLPRLYGRARPLRSTDLGGGTDPYIDMQWTWADSHASWLEIVPCDSRTMSRRAPPRNQWPDAQKDILCTQSLPDRPDVVHLDRRDLGLVR